MNVSAVIHQDIHLKETGYVSNDSKLPECRNGRIKLLSYRYQLKLNGVESNFKKLSAEAEYIIHEMCSLKPACTISRPFPLPDIGVHANITVEIILECIGKFNDKCGVQRYKTY